MDIRLIPNTNENIFCIIFKSFDIILYDCGYQAQFEQKYKCANINKSFDILLYCVEFIFVHMQIICTNL